MAGVTKYGKPVGINAKFKVDLLVVGSVAVDPTTGARLGKGEGFAELEYGMLRHMGAIDDFTLIVTSVHDKQLVSDIPVEKLFVHDVPVDVICTPTQIIQTHTSIPKPEGIYWDKLSPQKLSQIKVLQELKKQIEKETGEEICIGADEPLPPLPERKVLKPYAENSGTTNPGLVIWSFDELVTPEELHAHLDKLGITAVKIDVFPESGPIPAMARVYLPGGEDINKLISLIDKTEIRGRNICCQIDKASERQSHRRRR
ncbi:hypothetical protein O6H91_16G095500 [Diphasiastrum complanatum]|uniref:Uncharacterized protein n=1 Tax=Diphasiastrum complanatum TaxID=34168 RepID=A0ACC2BF50_DIPCM|nr:hypothetical protein O6H91_16G095500 [Diphasiastrum complanatum]